MTEQEWLACGDPLQLLDRIESESRRKVRLLACAACRHVWCEVRDERCRDELRAAEQLADGCASHTMLETASWEAELAYEEARHSVRPEVLALYSAISLTVGEVDVADLAAIFRATADLAPFGKNARLTQADLIREIFGNLFRQLAFDVMWRTTDVRLLAEGIYAANAFDRMPILADALQEAGCDSDELLNHLRDPHAIHVRGCWSLDLILGKS
jgi:hypothetical protein